MYRGIWEKGYPTMRSALWFGVGVLAVTVLAVASLANEALSSVDLFPPDAQEIEYQEETRRVIERLVEAARRHASEEEMESIRKEQRELAKRFFDYNKTRLEFPTKSARGYGQGG